MTHNMNLSNIRSANIGSRNVRSGRSRVATVRLASALAAAALVGTACASTAQTPGGDNQASLDQASLDSTDSARSAATASTGRNAAVDTTIAPPTTEPTGATEPDKPTEPDEPGPARPAGPDDLAPTPTDPGPTPTPQGPSDLAPTPTDPDPTPTPQGPSDLVAVPAICGEFGEAPPLAGIVSEIFADLDDDGATDDSVITYRNGDDWTLRTQVAGTTSEVIISGVGPGSAHVLGLADVAELTLGVEIIATVGSGASAQSIGVFGLDDNDCLFRFIDNTDEALTMFAGASIGMGSQFFCGDGYIGQASWTLEGDGTYDMFDYALIEAVPGTFSYMPSSDGFYEFLTADELPTESISCNGLTL